jgi:hypothetical protein
LIPEKLLSVAPLRQALTATKLPGEQLAKAAKIN